MSKDVTISKALSWLLRHAAVKEGLQISSDGYISVHDILKHSRFKNYSIEDIKRVVTINDKQRFAIRLTDNVLNIKANQGHSLTCVNDLDLIEILSVSDLPNCIHGTFFKNWDSIKINGLSRVNRLHIHFAIGLPNDNNVISGMRRSCQVYIYLDAEKALKNHLKFYKSTNNVILSPGNQDGLIATRFFLKVVNAQSGALLAY